MPPRARLVERVYRIIDTGFADPDLDLPRVAACAGISVRYLHQILEDAPETAGARILRRRLEALAAGLDPELAGASITQIGFASGFSSASHISRAFREHFGQAPSAFRRAALESRR